MAGVNQAFSQDAISKFFTKYQSDESFSQVNVSSKMFSLFTNMEATTPEDKEVLEAISKLKGLKILAKENTSDARTLYKEAYALIPKNEFEELMSVRDKDKDMKFYIKETGGKISELVMIMGGTEDFMVMSLFGEIDLKQVSRIGHKMNVDGLEKLEKMENNKKN
jgi:CII-binding regulator of phage lambda lysogenization HflD